jgi:hypothetical protein
VPADPPGSSAAAFTNAGLPPVQVIRTRDLKRACRPARVERRRIYECWATARPGVQVIRTRDLKRACPPIRPGRTVPSASAALLEPEGILGQAHNCVGCVLFRALATLSGARYVLSCCL